MERELLHKLFKGNVSGEELSAIRKWVESAPENENIFIAERHFYDMLQLSDAGNGKEEKRSRHYLNWKMWRKIAAAIIILLSINIVYLVSDKETTAMNLITVPAGQHVDLVLADGTKVSLNACSELSYPTSFNGDLREIYLKGEAFFDVTKNKKQQFIVHSGRYDIKVFGTKFNVSADSASNTFTTTLLEGSVEVADTELPEQSIMLTPDNIAYSENGQLAVKPISDYDYYRWKDGLICFKNTSFKDLMARLEKNYNLQIVIQNKELDNYMCGGTFRISDGISDILRVLQRDASFTFEFSNNRSTVYIK